MLLFQAQAQAQAQTAPIKSGTAPYLPRPNQQLTTLTVPSCRKAPIVRFADAPAGVSIAWVMQFLPASILFKEPRSANGLLNFPGNDKVQAPVEFNFIFRLPAHGVTANTNTNTNNNAPVRDSVAVAAAAMQSTALHCTALQTSQIEQY
jgi:hypothetical protein